MNNLCSVCLPAFSLIFHIFLVFMDFLSFLSHLLWGWWILLKLYENDQNRNYILSENIRKKKNKQSSWMCVCLCTSIINRSKQAWCILIWCHSRIFRFTWTSFIHFRLVILYFNSNENNLCELISRFVLRR